MRGSVEWIEEGRARIRAILEERRAERREVPRTISPARLAEVRRWLDENECIPSPDTYTRGQGLRPGEGTL